MAKTDQATKQQGGITFEELKDEVLKDYEIVSRSREASLLGRKEVLTGKAKFGIFGDGKELAQVALAKQFKHGDWRSGYYRDQTIMFALNVLNVQQWFAQLYAHADLEADPATAGRQMNSHFATRSLDENGDWKDLTSQYNSSPDGSPTASQMPRSLGLAQASKVFRNNKALHGYDQFSSKGDEVVFATIGDASTSEGHFWETINAAGVLQVPLVVSVWDDGWGISVPKKYQTTKGSISELLKGFEKKKDTNGFRLYNVKAWDYATLVKTYEEAVDATRKDHVPCVIHVEEVTQLQGHSTSGSHERYKSQELLEWYKEFDCLAKFREWILDFKHNGMPLATQAMLDEIDAAAKKQIRNEQKAAWKAYGDPIKAELNEAVGLLNALGNDEASASAQELSSAMDPGRKEIVSTVRRALYATRGQDSDARTSLHQWLTNRLVENEERYSSHLYSQSDKSCLNIEAVAPEYDDDAEMVDGRIIIRDNFAELFEREPLLLTFGEDTGKIGDVNQGMEGMQERFGEIRISDTGIRETTIIGQGIGMALRGLRPIAEIQYLDYLAYCQQTLSDDLATTQYRTKGGQKAPLIIRTRGHRLEGIWHSGSPMGSIINALRGIVVCVPRNMCEAAGMYNTLIQSDDAALVIEPLNGYRTKERKPTNLGDYCIPIGIPDVVREGNDLTIVSYGSTFNICDKALELLTDMGVDVELIDIRTLLPFDINGVIVESLKKTNRILFVDEDVPGGASAFMLDQVLNKQDGYHHLDSAPRTLAAKAHRPAYGSDGDYFSKPSIEDVVDAAYGLMSEVEPGRFGSI